MEMIFENAAGSVRLDGGRGGAPFRIRAAEGLGFMSMTANAAEYPHRPGQRTLSRTANARVITVSFDDAEAGAASEGRLARIFHGDGRLTVVCGSKRVHADCYVSAMTAQQRYGADFGRYAAQFTCDYPYFKGETRLEPLFGREELIRPQFSLPTVLSRRTVGASIAVGGDGDVYPRLILGNLSSAEDFTLAVVNETTGAALRLKLPAGTYSSVEADLGEGSISCEGEDLTRCLDGDSYMSDFLLRRGTNELTISADGINAATSATVEFEEEYVSALEEA